MALILVQTGPALGDEMKLEHIFDHPNPTGGDRFGGAVALDEGRALIGAFRDANDGFHVGRAFLFDSATGEMQRTFRHPSPEEREFFGSSLALHSNLALIGAPGDSAQGRDVGSAHLFDTVSGSLLQTFDHPEPTGRELFGRAVAVDSDVALISATGPGPDQGFLFDTFTGDLLHSFSNPSPDIDRGHFGGSLALADGQALFGARTDSTQGSTVGRAHLFDTGSGDLLQTFDHPSPTGHDQFGSSVALDDGTALIGAHRDSNQGREMGRAYLFDTVTGDLRQTFENPDRRDQGNFGSAVALDQGEALIGALGDGTQGDRGGRAFRFDATTGELLQTFDDPSPTNRDNFGTSVALDGDEAVIGAHFDDTQGERVGRAFLYGSDDPVEGPFQRIPDERLRAITDSEWNAVFGHTINRDGRVTAGDETLDPSLPTILVTHGLQPGMAVRPSPFDTTGNNPLGPLVEDIEERVALELAGSDAEQVNVLYAHWADAYTPESTIREAASSRRVRDRILGASRDIHRSLMDKFGLEEGDDLAGSLHLIGHSYGTIVNARLANLLSNDGNAVNQMTVLDDPDSINPFVRYDLERLIDSGADIRYADNYYGLTGGPQAGMAPDNGDPDLRPTGGQALSRVGHTGVWKEFYKGLVDSDVSFLELDREYGNVEGGLAVGDWTTSALDHLFQFRQPPRSYNPSPVALSAPNLVDDVFAYAEGDGFYSTAGEVVQTDEGVLVTTASPGAISQRFFLDEGDYRFTFELTIENASDGDWLTIMLDDELVWGFTLDAGMDGLPWRDMAFFGSHEDGWYDLQFGLFGDTPGSAFELTGYDMERVAAVPVPATAPLTGAGLLLLWIVQVRRRSRAQ